MAQAEMSYTLNQSHRAYEIAVNDGGFDGGTNCVASINVGVLGNIPVENLEAAVQAFADSLSSPATYTLEYINKIAVTETPL